MPSHTQVDTPALPSTPALLSQSENLDFIPSPTDLPEDDFVAPSTNGTSEPKRKRKRDNTRVCDSLLIITFVADSSSYSSQNYKSGSRFETQLLTRSYGMTD